MSTNNCTYLACHETACFAKRYTQAESWKREKLEFQENKKGIPILRKIRINFAQSKL